MTTYKGIDDLNPTIFGETLCCVTEVTETLWHQWWMEQLQTTKAPDEMRNMLLNSEHEEDHWHLLKQVEAVREAKGSFALRHHLIDLAASIEAMNVEHDLTDEIIERIGCWDFEYIPNLMERLARLHGEDLFDTPPAEIYKVTLQMLEEAKAK